MTIMMRVYNSDTFGFFCTLLSILRTNTIDELFVFYNEDSALDKNAVCRMFGDSKCRIIFINLDSVDEVLVEEKCELINMALAVKKLTDSDRILYVSNDTIICGNISQLYNNDFKNRTIIARAQSIEGVRRVGEVVEKGQLFDIRVLLFNLVKTNLDLVTYEALPLVNAKSEQGFLNVLFKDDVLLIYDIEFNFRYSIYSMAARNGIEVGKINPLIVSFERRDYYYSNHIGRANEFCLDEVTIQNAIDNGLILIPYCFRDVFQVSLKVLGFWKQLMKEIDNNYYEKIICKSREILIGDNTLSHRKTMHVLESIKNNEYVDMGSFKKVKYYDLNRYVDTLESNEGVAFLHKIQEYAISILKGKKAKVGYVVYSSSEWQCEILFKLLEDDPCFENYIFVTSLDIGDERTRAELVEETFQFFDDKKKLINMYSGSADDGMIDEMDILIYFSPFEYIPKEVNISNRSINQLCIHIPYAFYIENKDDLRYGDTFYDKLFFRMIWRYYASCERDVEYASERQRFCGYNIRFSGLPKVDELINKSFTIRKNLWKVSNNTKLKVLWAPHFNMAKGMNGTFHENYRWFFNFAKKHNEVSWIVKPHPRMKIGVVEAGVFKNVNEYEKYLDGWQSLNNARVIEYGNYYDIFETSDAMILDSLSFIVEYLYSGKPQLLLLSEKPRELGGIGNDAVDQLYRTRANNYSAIEKFIENCINKRDVMKELREKFVSKELDYYGRNGMGASKYIYNELKKLIL